MCDEYDRQILLKVAYLTTRTGGVTAAQIFAYALWTEIVVLSLGDTLAHPRRGHVVLLAEVNQLPHCYYI